MTLLKQPFNTENPTTISKTKRKTPEQKATKP